LHSAGPAGKPDFMSSIETSLTLVVSFAASAAFFHAFWYRAFPRRPRVP